MNAGIQNPGYKSIFHSDRNLIKPLPKAVFQLPVLPGRGCLLIKLPEKELVKKEVWI